MTIANSSKRASNTDYCVSEALLPRVSIVVVNTNELHHLEHLLPSLFAQDYPDYEVLIVDNGSTDNSLNYVTENFPEARIICNQRNLGYAGANNAGFSSASGQYIAVLNPDTRVEPGWLREIIMALESDSEAALATPKILLMDNPQKINACGNQITFSGLTVCRGLDEPAHHYPTQEIVSAVSGAAFVVRKSVLDRIGGFDERFFIYYEETDLCLRAMLAGYHCLYVPRAVVYHHYSFRFGACKAFWQERNRYFALLKTFDWRTFVVLSPTLALGEAIAWGYAILHGREHIISKVRAYGWIVSHRREIKDARRQTQLLRTTKDRAILARLNHRINFAQTASPLIASFLDRVVNPLLFLMGSGSRIIVRW